MNDWLIHHFRQPGRPKCLILIGPTETGYSSINERMKFKMISFFFWILGKTSFARSLPGFANHCRGVWSTDSWDDTADYMIIDDVPWDEFRTRGFPNPEELITCQQFLNVGDHIYIERNAEYLLWIRSKTNRIGFVVLTQQCQR